MHVNTNTAPTVQMQCKSGKTVLIAEQKVKGTKVGSGVNFYLVGDWYEDMKI